MNLSRSAALLGAVSALLVAACTDPKIASKDGFRDALQLWFDAHPECVAIGDMPAEIRMDSRSRLIPALEALTATGLLSAESGHTEQPKLMGIDVGFDFRRYRPTEAGAKAFRKSDDPLFGGSKLCFAKRRVRHVLSFTEPGDVMGLQVSQVSYLYELEDIAAWAKDAAIRKALPEIDRAVSQQQGEANASLVLTSEGWRHQLRRGAQAR